MKLQRHAEAFALPANQLLRLELGRLAFHLFRIEGDAIGMIAADSPRIQELALGFDYRTARRTTSPLPVPLQPGEHVVIGRRTGIAVPNAPPDGKLIDRGIIIYNQDGVFDLARTELLADRVMRLVVRADNLLSHMHAAVYMDGSAITIEDLGSTNGTHVTLQPIVPTQQQTS